MSDRTVTPEMLRAGLEAAWTVGHIGPTDKTLAAIYLAMERTWLSQEDSARQARMKAREDTQR